MRIGKIKTTKNSKTLNTRPLTRYTCDFSPYSLDTDCIKSRMSLEVTVKHIVQRSALHIAMTIHTLFLHLDYHKPGVIQLIRTLLTPFRGWENPRKLCHDFAPNLLFSLSKWGRRNNLHIFINSYYARDLSANESGLTDSVSLWIVLQAVWSPWG